jgi:cytochrome c556
MKKHIRKLALAGMAVAVTLGGVAAGMAAMDDVIKQRRELMKHNKEMFVPLVKMVKGAQPFDAATVKKNAEAIAADLERASKLFPEDSDTGDTRAKPEIWLLEDEFQALFKTAIEKAKALAQVTSPEQLAPAVMALGGEGCKACHEKFRKPKKKM